MKSLFGGSAGLGLALLAATLLFTSPLAAETGNPSAKPQPTPVQTIQEEALNTTASVPLSADGSVSTAPAASSAATEDEGARAAAQPVAPAAPPIAYVATAYSLRGRGASGLGVRKGTIAADP